MRRGLFIGIFIFIFSLNVSTTMSFAEEALAKESTPIITQQHTIHNILEGLAKDPIATFLENKHFLFKFLVIFYLITILIVSPYLYALFLFLLFLIPKTIWNIIFLIAGLLFGKNRIDNLQLFLEKYLPTLPNFSEKMIDYSRAEAFSHGRKSSFNGKRASGSW